MADELSPTYIREGVEFSVKLRGYDLEQVDDFLDRVADGIEVLQHQLRQALERAARAETSATEHAETETVMRRTLLLAQQAADETAKEADERAAAVVADAEQRAGEIVAEAERRVRATVAAAEKEAARVARDAQRSLREDLASLEAAKVSLQTDIDALGDFLASERERLHRLADEQLHPRAAPAPTAVAVPVEPAMPVETSDVADAPPDVDLVAASSADARADDGGDGEAPERELAPVPERVGAAGLEIVDLDTAGADDPFLDELRKARGDESPLGPRDDDVFAGFEPMHDEHDLGLDRTRWGRRRRR